MSRSLGSRFKAGAAPPLYVGTQLCVVRVSGQCPSVCGAGGKVEMLRRPTSQKTGPGPLASSYRLRGQGGNEGSRRPKPRRGPIARRSYARGRARFPETRPHLPSRALSPATRAACAAPFDPRIQKKSTGDQAATLVPRFKESFACTFSLTTWPSSSWAVSFPCMDWVEHICTFKAAIRLSAGHFGIWHMDVCFRSRKGAAQVRQQV